MNSAATLQETLESVRSQGYPRLEHIVVDGGSTDGTLELLAAAPDVRWISEPDEGRVDAVNKGLRMATGDIVAWLNADDRYEPCALHTVGEALARTPGAAWATGYCRIIDGSGHEIRRAVTAYKSFLLRRWTLGLYLTQNFVADPATFVRTSAVNAVGPLNPAYLTSHDYDLWLRVARRFGPPVVLRRPLASFRMTEGTLSMAGFEGQFAEHLAAARSHGDGHRLAVAVNRAMSGAIVLTYKALRLRRQMASR